MTDETKHTQEPWTIYVDGHGDRFIADEIGDIVSKVDRPEYDTMLPSESQADRIVESINSCSKNQATIKELRTALMNARSGFLDAKDGRLSPEFAIAHMDWIDAAISKAKATL